jgi:hypothetical protein
MQMHESGLDSQRVSWRGTVGQLVRGLVSGLTQGLVRGRVPGGAGTLKPRGIGGPVLGGEGPCLFLEVR